MGRKYIVTVENVAVAATQDLLQIKGATGKMLLVRRLKWANTDTALPTAQMIRTSVVYLPATVTDGSGGTTPTAKPIDPGDAAASFTAKANNTTNATTSGTAITLFADGSHVQAGFEKTFENPIPIGPSESLAFVLLAAPSASLHLDIVAEVEEIGG